MAFAGFDTDQFPGLATMAWLKANTNLVFCGFYLAPAPSHADTGWMAARADLAAAGWGFLPVFVGQELQGPGSHLVSAERGRADGELAAALMAAAGFPRHSRLFLDLEDGAPWAEPRISYVTAWALAVQTPYDGAPGEIGWHAGVYCSHAIAEAVRQSLVGASVESPQIWAFHVETTAAHQVNGPYWDEWAADPADPYAIAVQHDQNALIEVDDGHWLQVDLSTSLYADPSQP